jgi:hypothetical protein
VRRVTFKPQDPGRNSNFIFRILGYGKVYGCPNIRKNPGKIDKSSSWSDIFGKTFFGELLSGFVLPSDTYGK